MYKNFTKRQLDVLLLTGMLTGFYDFVLELIASFYKASSDTDLLVDVVVALASDRKDMLESDLMKLISSCQKFPEKSYLMAK